jgi:predicted extracellular nuclease
MKKSTFNWITTSFLIIYPIKLPAQSAIIGFYNCENFYDTLHQAHIIDEDFLPTSDKKYTSELYQIKTRHLANVLFSMGKMNGSNGIAFMGLAEIENKMVLNNLTNDPLIKKYHYKVIHLDSKDPRGVDVGFIYNPIQFVPYQYQSFSLTDATHFTHYATRDILYIKGKLANQWVHILVNHWPSRRGGESQSAEKRIWASTICKRIMDSVISENRNAKFIVMGDFNDNPNNRSIKMLKMINPFLKMYQNGMGSIAYQDSWSLFDQILLSPNWAQSDSGKRGEFYLNNYKPVIYKNTNMIEMQGKYQGYPKRTYNGNEFRGGYSDHFPVALIFTLKKAENPQ